MSKGWTEWKSHDSFPRPKAWQCTSFTWYLKLFTIHVILHFIPLSTDAHYIAPVWHGIFLSPRPIFRVQGKKLSMRKEKSYVWLSGTHVPTNQPEQEIGFRVYLDHKFIPFQHMWDARWMLRIHIYFPIYFESMSLVIPFELTRIIGRNRRIIFTTCLPRAGMLCEIHFSFSCNKGKIPITCKKRFVPSWVVLKAECQNAGMEECRNAGMSECRNVGMPECRKLKAGILKPGITKNRPEISK